MTLFAFNSKAQAVNRLAHSCATVSRCISLATLTTTLEKASLVAELWFALALTSEVML